MSRREFGFRVSRVWLRWHGWDRHGGGVVVCLGWWVMVNIFLCENIIGDFFSLKGLPEI